MRDGPKEICAFVSLRSHEEEWTQQRQNDREHFRLEDSFVNLKGRQLSPLKTEDVKLVAKPKTRGRFTVRPRILYVDETGSYKSIKEMGLTGWVKGR